MILTGRTEIGTLPSFIVIGAMKAGTTSLYHYLRDHPQVFMPAVKELDFFSERGNWDRGLDWYRRQFQAAGDAAAVGEASTTYSKHPIVQGVPERIVGLMPGCRIVYVLRDPIERIRSHYQHRVALGTERRPIEEAVFKDPIYLTCSSYGHQVEQYLRHFSPEQLLLVTSEDLREDRLATMRHAYAFLEVDQDVAPGSLDREYYRTESRATYSPALWKLRHALKERFPASKRAKEFVDATLPRLLGRTKHRSLGHEGRPSAVMPNALKARLADALREDIRLLQRHMPEGFDGWGLP
jgi:hypothetical protein